ncbi:MAG: enoyl-CoA hydratase/isomerase family protein [Deltaproteobacteria bacterium]|nr:enoyl-CoA hydratase/isomerase family protein [Deltaproteobacteria bacterium]
MRVERHVAWLCLQRSKAGNRIDATAARAICDAVEEIDYDEEVRVVVLTAEGKEFCLGVEDGGAWEQRDDWVAAVARLRQPVVAVVQGDAVAEGLELALACDLRVASSSVRLAMNQIQEQHLPVHGGTQRLPRIVGRTRALDLLLSGRAIGAIEAQRMGLVSRVVPRRRLTFVSRQLAADLSTKGPIALRFAKEAILKGSDMTLAQGIRLEEDLYALLQTTADRREGVRAFVQKRRPMLTGR